MAAAGRAGLGRRAFLGLAVASLVGTAGCVVREGADPQPFVPVSDEGEEEALSDSVGELT